MNDYKIAKNPITKGKNFSDNAFLLKYVSKIPEELECVYFPYKNKRYYNNRYLNHPYYKYQLLSVCFKSEVLAVLVVRKVFYETCSCIRIVDVCGDLKRIDNIYGNFQKLLDAENAEYIDCYNCGIPKEQFEKMGFVEVEKDTIIPNYFEPFEQKNIELRYASYAATSVVMFKGDCDQDRPNLL